MKFKTIKKVHIDTNSQKRLIDSFVNSIYLYDDKILFSFNYNDVSHELTLAELEAEIGSNFNITTPPRKKHPFKGVFFLPILGQKFANRYYITKTKRLFHLQKPLKNSCDKNDNKNND